jgi:5-methylcytosine-specific restriction endonuclease McrA
MTVLIQIAGDICWICGSKTNGIITNHHAIPLHLHPVNNILVPLCRECHKKITDTSITGVYSAMSKIIYRTDELNKQIRVLQKVLQAQKELAEKVK